MDSIKNPIAPLFFAGRGVGVKNPAPRLPESVAGFPG
jgi:hypothetical protein